MSDKIDFLQLYEEIYKILPASDIQSLMEVCYKIVGVPILTVDIMYNVLGACPNHKIDDYMWDYLIEHRGYDTDLVATLYEEGIIQSVDTLEAPYVVDWGSCKDRPKIQGIVKINNTVEGYVTMNCNYNEITSDRIKAMEIIMNLCAYFFKGTHSESNMRETHQKVFARELFNHRIQTEKQLTTWFKDMGCEMAPPYSLMAVRAWETSETNILSYIRKSVQLLSPWQLLLIQNNILYILHYNWVKTRYTQSILTAFQKTLVKFNARCGVSNTFDNLLYVSSYQKQAEDALSLGCSLVPAQYLHHYTDYYLPALLVPSMRQMPKENYLPQTIKQMEHYDMEHATEFYTTLQCYIRNLSSTIDTAKELHIHRNTLLYRIHKIEELFGLSLKDYHTYMHLMIVFYMMELEQSLKV